ncbi:hypothetical protein R6Q59_029965 [Mikania micrantha]
MERWRQAIHENRATRETRRLVDANRSRFTGYHITLSYQFAMGYKIAGLAKVGYGYLGINGTAGWAYLSYCWIAFECLGL